jgi:hypothetical protein
MKGLYRGIGRNLHSYTSYHYVHLALVVRARNAAAPG